MSSHLTPRYAMHLLRDVHARNHFTLHLGTKVRNLKELAELLEIISEPSFRKHVSEKKNDFAEWVDQKLKDEELAHMIKTIHDRAEMVRVVRARVGQLERIAATDLVDSHRFMQTGLRDFVVGAAIGILVGIVFAMLL